jgi:hypothetical protein
VGSLLVVTAFVLLWVETFKLNLPKENIYRIAVMIEAAGVIVYAMHLFTQSLPVLDVVGFLLFVAAFVLLYLGIILKDF